MNNCLSAGNNIFPWSYLTLPFIKIDTGCKFEKYCESDVSHLKAELSILYMTVNKILSSYYVLVIILPRCIKYQMQWNRADSVTNNHYKDLFGSTKEGK